ncbi:transportin-1-like [Tripterygium wilfordii]|uniref:transportin-1-like n=1 Tax=Tripterygium wilfordii TaxID=458696 RepID=UPI0018F7EAB5|nr:transportin-1-like [Tripterygium wilfordii]
MFFLFTMFSWPCELFHPDGIAYHSIGTLADAVVAESNQSMQFLVSINCKVASALKFRRQRLSFVPVVYDITTEQALILNIIQTQQLAKVDSVSAGALYDKGSLKLFSGLAEVM